MDSWLHTSLWLPNTVSTKHELFLCPTKPSLLWACLPLLNLTTLPLDHAALIARSTLPLGSFLFHSSGHFLMLFSLSGTQFLQIHMGHLFPITQGSPQCHFLREATLGILANRRKDPSCPTIFIHSSVCFHRPCDLCIYLFTVYIVYYHLLVYCLCFRDFGCYTKVSPPALEGIWSQFSKYLWNECMIAGISESESVSWGLQEELMRQRGRETWPFFCSPPSLLWLLTSSWWSGCSLIYWWAARLSLTTAASLRAESKVPLCHLVF